MDTSIKMIALGTTAPAYDCCTAGTVFTTGVKIDVGVTFA